MFARTRGEQDAGSTRERRECGASRESRGADHSSGCVARVSLCDREADKHWGDRDVGYAPHDVRELRRGVRLSVVRMRVRPRLIRSFVAASHLYD
jgi:hypothetical protein